MVLTMNLPVVVHPKQADRSRIVRGGGKPWIQHYQPKEVEENKRLLAEALSPHQPAEPLKGPVRMRATFRFPWPKSVPKKLRKLGWLYREAKPDVENLSKQLCDVLEDLEFVKNDSQIVDSRLIKIMSDDPGTRITLEEL